MKRFIILVGMCIGGSIGWRLGSYIGFMTAFFISMAGTGLGMYAANMAIRRYMV